MTSQTKILVRNFIVPAMIGIYDHEKLKPQRIRVSIDVTLAKDVIGADDIASTMSYETLVKSIRDLARTHHSLVETIAEHLARVALADPQAQSVLVRVEKLDVYTEGSVGTEIIRSKS